MNGREDDRWFWRTMILIVATIAAISIVEMTAKDDGAKQTCAMIKTRALTTAQGIREPGTMSRVELIERALYLSDLIVTCSGESSFDFATLSECRGREDFRCVADVIERAALRIK